jgi:hypothetical protein
MLCLAGGEGGTRPLGVLAGQGACASCAFAAAWSPRKPQQPSFHLLRDLHRHMFQIVNDIETDRFIYIYIYRHFHGYSEAEEEVSLWTFNKHFQEDEAMAA